MKLSDRVSIPAEVMARQVGDETVILDLASGTYFGLDPVGARIWELLGEGNTLSRVRDEMLEEYDVSREQLEADLLRISEELLGKGLVECLSP